MEKGWGVELVVCHSYVLIFGRRLEYDRVRSIDLWALVWVRVDE